MPKLLLFLLPLFLSSCLKQELPVESDAPTLGVFPTLRIFKEQRQNGERVFVTITAPAIEGGMVDLWCYENEFKQPEQIVERDGKIFLVHEYGGNRLESSFEPEPDGVVMTVALTGPDPESIAKVPIANMCITYQRSSAFGNKKDKFDESYLEDFIGRSFVLLDRGLTRLIDTVRIPSVDPRDNPYSARGRATKPWVQTYVPTWREHADFVHTFYGKRPLSPDRPVYPIMGVVSQDKRFMSAFAWPDCHSLGQLFISCIHPNPMMAANYDPETDRAVTRGKLYFMENDPEKLLGAFGRDFPDWKRPPDAD